MNTKKGKNIKGEKLKDKIIILMKNIKPISTKGLVMLVILSFSLFLLVGNNLGFTEKKDLKYKSLKNKDNTKITFTGDVSPSRYLKEISSKYGHNIYYKDIKEIWKDSDISLINLEAAVLEDDPEEVEYDRLESPLKNIYLDVAREDVKAIKEAGIDLIGFANNHSMDYGVEGLIESMNIFQDEGIEYIGAGNNIYEAIEPYTREINNKKISITAITDVLVRGARATTNIPGITTTGYAHMEYELERTIRNNDFNIVYIHWGTEYALRPNKEIEELGRELIDMGVDLVVGSHPHVLLPVEKYKDGLIVYSMGNLIFDQKTGRTTDSAIANLYLEDGKRYFEFLPIDIRDGIPYQTDNKRLVKRVFKNLTKYLDENDYQIDNNKLIIDF